MAVNGLAGFHGSAVHPTRVLRNLAATVLGQPSITHANSATATTRGGCYGVVAGSDLAVTATSGLGYSIAAGRLAGPGTTALAQGGYVGYNDAAVTGTLAARNATNPRIDYVAYRVRDTDEDATGAEDDGFVQVAGTPAASPVPPTVASSLGTLVILAEILVPSTANGGPIVITDRRAYLNAIGGTQRCTSSGRPTGAAVWPCLNIIETDTGRTYKRNTANSAWVPTSGRYGTESVNLAAGPLAGGATATIGYTSETEDTDGYHTGTSTQIVVPSGLTGFYGVFVFVQAASAAMTGPGQVTIFKNGSAAATDFMQTSTQVMSMFLEIPLVASDIIEVSITNNSGTSQAFLLVTRVYRLGD